METFPKLSYCKAEFTKVRLSIIISGECAKQIIQFGILITAAM